MINRRYAAMFFTQTRFLLFISLAAMLITGTKFLPDDPLVNSIPYYAIAPFANIMLNLTILTGLLGGGMYAFMKSDAADTNEQLLKVGYWLWTGLLVLAVFASIFDLNEGRHMLEMPFLLHVLQVIAMAVLLVGVGMNIKEWSPTAILWLLGIALSIGCVILGLLPADSYMQDRVWRILAVGLNVNLAYVWAAMGLGFWLMTNFTAMIEPPVYLFAGLVTVANTLVSLAPLSILEGKAFCYIATAFVMLVYVASGAYTYHALRNRNTETTLAGHWYALAMVLYMAGIGLLGSIQILPDVIQWTQGTRLTDLQITLTAFGTLAIVLGVISHTSGGGRGRYAFWMVALGVMSSGLFLGGAGIVQTYAERMLSIGYLDVQILLIPLYMLWLGAMVVMAVGVGLLPRR